MSLEDCRSKSWFHRVARSLDDICAVVPEGETLILVDGDEWGAGADLRGRRRLPFPERDGEYWGLPADGASAVAELDRLRGAGAAFAVVAWPAFWWLDHYAELADRLARSPCVLRNARLAIHDLR